MPKIDLAAIPLRTGTIYPDEYAGIVEGRSSLRVGDAGGLTQFGANIIILEPGAAASIRHWHVQEDEFLIVLSGELTLVEDEGETPMLPGDCAAFPAGVPNAHHMVNRSDAEARFIVVGTRTQGETAHYPDIGLKVDLTPDGPKFKYEDGSPYTPPERKD